tara:strand:- start:207 stop:515 length:309 start_codon:yes stop_codon:yes gene_type:complete
MMHDHDIGEFIEYVNNWQLGDISRNEKMYHKACAPHVNEEAWNAFWNLGLNVVEQTRSVEWVKMTHVRYEEMVERYSDFSPDTPPGNEYIIDWGDSDSDVES